MEAQVSLGPCPLLHGPRLACAPRLPGTWGSSLGAGLPLPGRVLSAALRFA